MATILTFDAREKHKPRTALYEALERDFGFVKFNPKTTKEYPNTTMVSTQDFPDYVDLKARIEQKFTEHGFQVTHILVGSLGAFAYNGPKKDSEFIKLRNDYQRATGSTWEEMKRLAGIDD